MGEPNQNEAIDAESGTRRTGSAPRRPHARPSLPRRTRALRHPGVLPRRRSFPNTAPTNMKASRVAMAALVTASAAPRNDRNVRQDEYLIWTEEDRHSQRAYKVLLNRDSIRISKNPRSREETAPRQSLPSIATRTILPRISDARKITPSQSRTASDAKAATAGLSAICGPTIQAARIRRISS